MGFINKGYGMWIDGEPFECNGFEFETDGMESDDPSFAQPVQFELVVSLDPYTRMIVELFLEGPPEGCNPGLN